MRALLGYLILPALMFGGAGCPRKQSTPQPLSEPALPTGKPGDPGGGPKDQTASAVAISATIKPEGPAVWGDLADADIVIQNHTSDLVILRRVEIQGQLPDIERWYGSQYGEARYDSEQDVYHFDSLVQVLSEPIFAGGVLLPGEIRGAERTVRLNRDRQVVEVQFQRLTEDEARKSLYVADPADSPLSQTFRRLAEPLGATASAEGSDRWDMVIFPQADETPMDTATAELSLGLAEREFDRQAAVRKASRAEPGNETYSLGQDAYIFDYGPDGVKMVTGRDVVALPQCDLLVFDLMDQRGDEPVELLLPLEGFEDLFTVGKPHTEGPGFFNPGYTDVPQADLPRLLERCRERGLSVTVQAIDPNGLGASHRVVVGEAGDLAQRRAAMQP
jgi:hypothetical protein